MTGTWSKLTTTEALEIERLLRAGYSVDEVRHASGRSSATVRAVRNACGIPVSPPGRRPKRDAPMPLDGPEGGWEPSGNPCELLYAERPYQQEWLDLLRTANPAQLERMRKAVCRTLQLSYFATGETLASAAIADRRTADELAAAYLGQVGLPPREAA